MTVVVARSVNRLSESKDFKGDVIKTIGNLDDIEVYFNHVLVATYIRSERTSGGIIRPDSNKQEDVWQGKVGLVLKKGPMAFKDDDNVSFEGLNVEPGNFIVYRKGDGWDVTIHGVACLMLTDRAIKMRIKSPEIVF